MEMYVFLLQPGLAARKKLAANFVAGWLLLSKLLDLSYLTPPLPLLVFAVQSNEDRELVGKNNAPRKHHRDQASIIIILEYQYFNNVKKLWLWRTNSGCNTRKCCQVIFTVKSFSCYFQ